MPTKTLHERGSSYLRQHRAGIKRKAPGAFSMPSAKGGKHYDVRVGPFWEPWCDCYQFAELGKASCKHIWAGEQIEKELRDSEPVVISREVLAKLVRQANEREAS